MPNLIFRLNVRATLRSMQIGEVLELFLDDVEEAHVRTAASRLKPMKFSVRKGEETLTITRKS